ncbi:hypothetical protein [Microbacterium sp. SA39]|uniref:hypothetical protein n=1 Tax=Microbacterium sp. SA39 TaxID=1263625 RepID=UPI0005F9FFB3|nr:hypothetical protein [Microbacterium sp. SA39]KJQ55159.1 hypothetical protein RS85_00933 [Microbacterium sp. SA39]
MTAVLERPAGYLDLLDEEFDDIDGGITWGAVAAIVTTAVAAGGATYAVGQAAGERAYHAGLRNSYYQQVKWQVRGTVVGFASSIGLVGTIAGALVMTGFENKFYSMG